MFKFLSRTLLLSVLSCSCTGLNALHSHTTSMGMDLSRGSIRQCCCSSTHRSANPQLNSFLFTCAKFPLGDKRDTLRKPGLVAALSLYESSHTTSQKGFPHHTGCAHSLCLSTNLGSLVVQQNKRELGIQRKICQRLYNTKPLRVV